MTNNQSKRMYCCEVQLKSGQRHKLRREYKESEIEISTSLLFNETGRIKVAADSKYNIKFIKAGEIECVTWQLLDSDNYNILNK